MKLREIFRIFAEFPLPIRGEIRNGEVENQSRLGSVYKPSGLHDLVIAMRIGAMRKRMAPSNMRVIEGGRKGDGKPKGALRLVEPSRRDS